MKYTPVVITVPDCAGSICELIVPCLDMTPHDDNDLETTAGISITAIYTASALHTEFYGLSVEGKFDPKSGNLVAVRRNAGNSELQSSPLLGADVFSERC